MIKAHGGVALAQDPAEALFDRMPASAARTVALDAVLPLDALAQELVRCAHGSGDGQPGALGGTTAVSQPNPEAGLQQVGAEITAWQQGTTTSDASGYSCPQCGGGIWQATEGPLLRFHCHTGHVYSPEAFANDQAEALETALWQAVRLLAER